MRNLFFGYFFSDKSSFGRFFSSKLFIGSLLILLCCNAFAIELRGQLLQGTLLRGNVVPGTQVWLDERLIVVNNNGDFALGFGRDDKLEWTLRWKEPGKSQQQQPLTLLARKYDEQSIEGLPQKMVTPPASVLKRIRKDSKMVREARNRTEQIPAFAQEFAWPAKGPISGVYGSRRILNGEPKRPHYGVDVVGPIGQPVYAPADGLITLFVPDMYYSGGTMIIDHGFGVSSTFLHLSKGHVKAGQSVTQGQLVAEIGDTGRVTGPHLDWRMNWFEKRIDPQLLVPEMPSK